MKTTNKKLNGRCEMASWKPLCEGESYYVHSRDDVKTYINNYCPSNDTEELLAYIVERRLTDSTAPEYGEDWGDWLLARVSEFESED